ncbi:hypothetical protein NW733_02715 [Mycoplasmopsis felis]|uniref:hypothetical protein n=1 Tax=Mycoplasmopsis felis TaxID=33923 RepID=UPI0021E0BACF|nr:hypothetical protein [Mycoplasmopsis felis]MCU9931606.1 hypothetical protein [Mycoplasmopsis felis]
MKIFLDDIFVYDEVIFHKNYFTINGKFYSIKAIDKIPYELENTWSKLIFNLNGTILENNFPYKNRKDIDKILNKASIHSEDRIQNEVQATEIVKAGLMLMRLMNLFIKFLRGLFIIRC